MKTTLTSHRDEIIMHAYRYEHRTFTLIRNNDCNVTIEAFMDWPVITIITAIDEDGRDLRDHLTTEERNQVVALWQSGINEEGV